MSFFFYLHSSTIFNIWPWNLNASKQSKKKVDDFLVDEDVIEVIEDDEEDEEELQEGNMVESDDDDEDDDEELDIGGDEWCRWCKLKNKWLFEVYCFCFLNLKKMMLERSLFDTSIDI